jgi:hypothetical protein
MNPSILTALALSAVLFLAFITSCTKAFIKPESPTGKKPVEGGKEISGSSVKLPLPKADLWTSDGQGGFVGAAKESLLFVKDGKTVSKAVKTDREPTAMAAGNGQIYIGAGDHVEVYDLSGNKKAAWSATSEDGLISGMAVTKDGIYAADASQKAVFRFSPDGKLLNVIDAKELGGFVVPSGHFSVADSGDGNVWITNPGKHQVVKFSPEGKVVSAFGAPGLTIEGFNACCNPMSIAVLPDGRIVTAEKGRVRVKVYTAEGRLDGIIGGTETFGTGIKILTLNIEDDGSVAVFDPTTGAVTRYARIIPAGEYHEG